MTNIENILENLSFDEKLKYYKSNNNDEKVQELVEEKFNENYHGFNLITKIQFGFHYNIDKEKIKEKIIEKIDEERKNYEESIKTFYPNKLYTELLQTQKSYSEFFDENMKKDMYDLSIKKISDIIIKSKEVNLFDTDILKERVTELVTNDENLKKNVVAELINKSDEITSPFKYVNEIINKIEKIEKNIYLKEEETINLAKKFKESLIKQEKYYLAVKLSEKYPSLKDENFKEVVSKYIESRTTLLGKIKNIRNWGDSDEETLLKYIEAYKVHLDKAPKLYTKLLKEAILYSISDGIKYVKNIKTINEETINKMVNWAISKNKSKKTLNYFLDADFSKLNNKSKKIIKDKIISYDDSKNNYFDRLSGENPYKRVLEYYLQIEDDINEKKKISKKMINSRDLVYNTDKTIDILDFLIEKEIFDKKDIYEISVCKIKERIFEGHVTKLAKHLKDKYNLKEDFGKECYNHCIYHNWLKEAENITEMFNLKEEKEAISSITKAIY